MGANEAAAQPARRAEPGCPVEGLNTDDAVGDDGLLGIDVAQERIQRPGPLTQTHGELRPLVGGHQARHQVDGEQLRARLTLDPEGDVVGALVLLDVAFPGPQHGNTELGDGVQDLFVGWPRPAAGVDGLVVADRGVPVGGVVLTIGVVAEQQRRVLPHGGRGVRPAARGFGDQLVDDVAESAAAAQLPALAGRRRPGDEHLPSQLTDHLPIACGLELRAQQPHEFGDDLGGRPADRTDDVDELAFQTRSGCPPQRGPAQRRGHLDGGDPRP